MKLKIRYTKFYYEIKIIYKYIKIIYIKIYIYIYIYIKEEYEINNKFHANPVPNHVHIPMY
jgi:hypothetical protein